MKFRTELQAQALSNRINYEDNILMMGSCFTVHVAKRMQSLGYSIFSNPSGITFNPVSMLHTLRRINYQNPLPEEEIFHNGSQWCHYDFHGSFNDADKQKAHEKMVNSLKNGHSFIKNSRFVILTIGTSFVYELTQKKKIVNNCHKQPGQLFERSLLSVQEIKEALDESMMLINQIAEHPLDIIFTLSPVRHIRDGLVNNQRSKSHALTAIHSICEKNENVSYFPSYEFLLDDLRDYRFYNRDLIHPSDEAVDYIFNHFELACLNPSEQGIRDEVSMLTRQMNHRSIDSDSEEHQKFKIKIETQRKSLLERYPFLNI